MFALLAALVLTVPTGEPGALDVVTGDVDFAANGNSNLSVSTREFGDPNQQTSDPPPEEPPQPVITAFSTLVTPGFTLAVEGTAVDEASGVSYIQINWLDNWYEVSVDSSGDFFWYIALEEGDEGWITAYAVNGFGMASEPAEDLIIPVW